MKKARGKERCRQLLTLNEVERLRGEIAAEKRYLGTFRGKSDIEHPEMGLSVAQVGKSLDASDVERRIARKERALAVMDPRNHRLEGAERQRAYKEMKDHEEFLKKNMLSTFDMGAYPKPDSHERNQNFARACDKSFAQEVGNPEFQRRAHRYKELARRLDPENPELPNIERLRPRRRY